MSKNRFLWFSLLVFIIVGGLPAHGEAQTGGPVSLVKEVLDRAMEIQTDPALSGDAHRRERARLIRGLIADNFLSESMAKNSLGTYWDGASLPQRNEFRDLFVVLFQDSYTRMVLNFLAKENVEYGSESRDGVSARVETTIVRVSEHIPVAYSLAQKDGRWYIEDVEIDGVSIVDNYRGSFTRVIRGSSFNDLLQRMRTQKQAITADNV